MAQSNEGEQEESMMEEALQILKEEGFSLPSDVIDTLTTASRSNPAVRRRGSLRGHKMCEVQSNSRKQRNVRESSAKRGERTSSSSDPNEDTPDMNNQGSKVNNGNGNLYNDVFEVSGVPEGANRFARTEREDISESSSSCSASTVKEKVDTSGSREYVNSLPYGSLGMRPQLSRQDSESSMASSASSLNRRLTQLEDRRGSYGSSTDAGYNTSIENAKQIHDARAENLKNMNKHIENKISECNNNTNGLKREISRDSGFTETGDVQRLTPTSLIPNNPTEYRSPVPVVGDSSREFKDMAVSNSDYKEQSLSTDHGDVHVITSTASDLSAAQMTSRNNEITEDGTVVSSASKLADEEGNSALSRITTKVTGDEVARMEDFEAENRRSKSSRNDSISTSASGVTTASSRHATSMDQELNQENSKISSSNDGRYQNSSISAAQQLTRNQEMDNIEKSTDGSSKTEHKKVCDKASLSKSNVEETKLSEDGLVADSMSASQQLEAKSNVMQNEEDVTSADGTRSFRRQDSTSSSFSEKSSSEKKTVKQLPYSNGSSTELTKKEESSQVSKSSKKSNEVKESGGSRTEKSNTEDSNAMSSSFSGKCESTEITNGSKLHKTLATENSSENRMKAVTSNMTYSKSGQRHEIPIQQSERRQEYPIQSNDRRLSDASSISTLSNISGLSRENIKPPSYEETMSNLSRAQSNSSLFSRQDSSASSIASSAGAFNERQRQKALANARTSSFDSNTDVKEIVESTQDANRIYGITRQDSYSSDSTLSGGNRNDYASPRRTVNNAYRNIDNGQLYQDSYTMETQEVGRVINHPIRQVGHSSYSRSYTDSVFERQPNRRATLTGDIVISEREVAEAREEVRAKLRGKDDTYVSRRSRVDERDETINRRDEPRAYRSGFDSFGREIMDIVDSFFEDDDDFAFGMTSRRRRSPDREKDNFVGRRAGQNPYTVREDLSRLSTSREGHLDSVGMSGTALEYAASDSGFQTSRRDYGDFYSTYTKGVSDSASDCGYDRLRSRNVDSNRALKTDPYQRNKYTDIGSTTREKSNTVSREYSGSSRFNDLTSAGDSFLNARKSINRDKKNNSSISRGNMRSDYSRLQDSSSGQNDRYRVQENVFDSRFINDNYCSRSESELDMNDAGSTTNSFRSLPPEVNQMSRGRDLLVDNYSTNSLPDIDNNERNPGSAGKHKMDDSRRERIDKALSWIRSELVSESLVSFLTHYQTTTF